ncbi:MAG TPA: class II fumarate hydratase [Acidimicrobiia bacterium]|nr:class II fumarate hydratase [Acidimicrobiia bacterium]
MPRIEHDSMGEVAVPDGAYWGAQTQRAVENFPISGLPIDRRLIWGLATIKAAAASVNAAMGIVDVERADAIRRAAEDVASGGFDDQFPVDVFQTGSGTSSNMNANEVIANRAGEMLGHELGSGHVHPNDHVNASQSSNDVFPTACHLAAYAAVKRELVPALAALAAALESKADAFDDVVKAGRTHLMDATPVTLGQEFGGWAAQVRYAIERLETTYSRLAEVPLGGTAVGTGLNQPPGWASAVLDVVRAGHPDLSDLREARNHFEAQGARDGLVELSGALRGAAVGLTKIANDIRWLGSGPRTGLGEIRLPELQPGSSIMPGKVNPVAAEAMRQVCAQVIGNDAAVAAGGAAGDFELNVMIPVMARNVLESIALLATASTTFVRTCVTGIEADVEACRRYAESSLPIVTALVPSLGYDACADISKQAMREGKTLREVVVERGLLSEADVARILDVDAMARGGVRSDDGSTAN